MRAGFFSPLPHRAVRGGRPSASGHPARCAVQPCVPGSHPPDASSASLTGRDHWKGLQTLSHISWGAESPRMENQTLRHWRRLEGWSGLWVHCGAASPRNFPSCDTGTLGSLNDVSPSPQLPRQQPPTLRSATVNQKGSVCLSVAGWFH